MAKEFIITEGDIDAALDLLLELEEYDPVDRWRKFANFYRDRAKVPASVDDSAPVEAALFLKRLRALKNAHPEELAKFKLPEPPESKVPATTGEKKAKFSQTLTPDQQEIIAQAEVTPEKKKSGNYDVVTIDGKEYDRDALKVAIRDVGKKAENLPIAAQNAQQTSLAIISNKIEDEEEEEAGKPVEADVNIHDISRTAKGYVSVVDNFTWKGGETTAVVKSMNLSANAGMFMEMTFVGQILDAVIKAGNSLVVEQNNLGSFYVQHVEPALKDSIEALILKLGLMGDAGEEEADDVAQQLFDEIAKQLKDKKKDLEKSPELTKKFNKIKGDYLELMVKQFEKSFEKEKETLTEEKLLEVTIDFSEIKRKNQHLDESFLVMFGGWVKWLLGKMFSGGSIPGTVKGSRSEVESFARAMASEKGHIETAKRYGLDHPATYKSKARLSSATSGFEKATGIKWPFE